MIFVQAWVIEDILRAIGVGIFPLNSWSEGNSGLINVHYVGTGISDCGKTNGQGGKTVTFDILIGGETMGKIVRWRKQKTKSDLQNKSKKSSSSFLAVQKDSFAM